VLTKATLLSNQFNSVFTQDTPDTANIQLQGQQYPPLEPVVVTDADVYKLLTILNP